MVEGWRISGVISFSTKREWERAVLALAVERGQIDEEDVARVLLDGRRPLAHRLLAICERLGLLRRDGRHWSPTPDGFATAATGEVLIPERGAWTLWCASDPLLQKPLLMVTPWPEPSLHEERKANLERNLEDLPASLQRVSGTLIHPLAGSAAALRVEDLGQSPKGERAERRGRLDLRLSITRDGVRLDVTGKIDGHNVEANQPAPELDYLATWRLLLTGANQGHVWDASRCALCVAFEQTTSIERSSMQRTVPLKNPSLANLGTFRDTSVAGVPLRAGSRKDAKDWAIWRLLEDVTTYVHPADLPTMFEAAAALFPEHSLDPPSTEELTARLRSNGRPGPKYWWLQAPLDWTLSASEQR